MNPLTREWIEKAEGDYAVAHRELRARKQPNYDGICFHAQQCAEKYLKARLHAAGIEFPHTHAIPVLVTLAVKLEAEWELLRKAAETLTDYAVRFRYPGANASKDQAREAIRHCELFREYARSALYLRAPRPAGGKSTRVKKKVKTKTSRRRR